MTSKDVGNITEVSCMLEFMKLGYPVLTPYGDCQRYDFVVEINNKFYRIQSKTANDAYINEGYIVESIGQHCGNIPYTCFSALKSYYGSNEVQIEKFANAIDTKIYYNTLEISKMKKLKELYLQKFFG